MKKSYYEMMIKLIAINFYINILFITLINGKLTEKRPNIVIIVTDDMGINDVSFRGSNQILTPNIDSLAYHGIILDRYYVPSLCTPSRGSLLTGKFPIHIGLQHFVIPNDEPWGLPLDQVTMPEIFHDAGYSTNLIGKWHLGFHKKEFTPLKRGYDYHFGYMGGYIDYYDHSLIMLNKNYSRGYDLRRNLHIEHSCNGSYVTDLFNDEAVRVIDSHDKSKPLFLVVNHLAPHAGNENNPMQAPPEGDDDFNYITNEKRRIYASMLLKVDEGIGRLVDALHDNNMLENSIILFYSDNGAPTAGLHSNAGSNYPLRGQKNGPWEGGIRSPGIIWSPLLKSKQRVSRQLIHVSDWLPTLAYAAGIELNRNLNLDGINMWEALSMGYKSPRINLLHNIDEIIGYSSYLRGRWKYINGTTSDGLYDNWLGYINPNEEDLNFHNYIEIILNTPVTKAIEGIKLEEDNEGHNYNNNNRLTENKILNMRRKSTIKCSKRLNYFSRGMKKYECKPLLRPCLFDIQYDPCEYYNLAWKYPLTVASLTADIKQYMKTLRKSVRISGGDPRSNPSLHNNTWTWWLDRGYDENKDYLC